MTPGCRGAGAGVNELSGKCGVRWGCSPAGTPCGAKPALAICRLSGRYRIFPVRSGSGGARELPGSGSARCIAPAVQDRSRRGSPGFAQILKTCRCSRDISCDLPDSIKGNCSCRRINARSGGTSAARRMTRPDGRQFEATPSIRRPDFTLSGRLRDRSCRIRGNLCTPHCYSGHNLLDWSGTIPGGNRCAFPR